MLSKYGFIRREIKYAVRKLFLFKRLWHISQLILKCWWSVLNLSDHLHHHFLLGGGGVLSFKSSACPPPPLPPKACTGDPLLAAAAQIGPVSPHQPRQQCCSCRTLFGQTSQSRWGLHHLGTRWHTRHVRGHVCLFAFTTKGRYNVATSDCVKENEATGFFWAYVLHAVTNRQTWTW